MKGERGEGGDVQVFSSGDGVCSHQFFATVLGSRRSRPVRDRSHPTVARPERAFWRAPPLGTGRAALIARAWRHRAIPHRAVFRRTRDTPARQDGDQRARGAGDRGCGRSARCAPRPPPRPRSRSRDRAAEQKKRSRTLFPPSPRPPYPLPRPAHPRPAAPPPPRTARQRPDGGSRQRHVDDQSRDPLKGGEPGEQDAHGRGRDGVQHQVHA